jgi:hypothetical protein
MPGVDSTALIHIVRGSDTRGHTLEVTKGSSLYKRVTEKIKTSGGCFMNNLHIKKNNLNLP